MADTRVREQLKYMSFLKEPPTKTAMYYMSGFTVLVAILLVAFAIRPTLLTIDRINSEVKEKQRIYDALDSKISAMVQLDTQYTEFSDNLDSLQLIYWGTSHSSPASVSGKARSKRRINSTR